PHHDSRGDRGAVAQGEVLSVSDPARSGAGLENGEERQWEDCVEALTARVGSLPQGQGLAVLTENVTSPTLGAQLQQLLATLPQAAWYQWDPVHPDNEVAGARLAFGADVRPVLDLTQADVIVSLGADFLDRGPGRLAYYRDIRQRLRGRQSPSPMTRPK